jgi:hypothetical protein
MLYGVQFRITRRSVIGNYYVVNGTKHDFKWTSRNYSKGIKMYCNGERVARYGVVPLCQMKDRCIEVGQDCEMPISITSLCFVLVDLWENLYSCKRILAAI